MTTIRGESSHDASHDPPDEYEPERLRALLVADDRVGEMDISLHIVGGRLFITGHVASCERRDAIEVVLVEAGIVMEICNEVMVMELPPPTTIESLS
jgi:hypothetical protein